MKDLIENKSFSITFVTICKQLEENYELDIESHMKAWNASNL